MSKIIVYIDGGARDNPGPAAIGVTIGEREYSKYLGRATNNEAEYAAAIFALKKIKQLIGKEKAKDAEVHIRSDSELLVNQLNGQFKIKEKDLIPLFIEIWNLKQDFGKIEFVQMMRSENKRADQLVNQELNSQRGLFG
ncbi:ribonuclease HI family protein [Candidatus Wolfebacteria bacterium]|nr:ribonuclease HI family protein [Candidatus Wolfebacteria bacterium]